MMPDWYFNTSNDSKAAEITYVFGNSGRMGILRQPIVELLETDLVKVVRAKAAAAYEVLRVPVIVEHGALCIDFMNGLPGALVKPTWMALGERLCHIVPAGEPRTCRAMSAICYCDGRTRTVIHREIEERSRRARRARGAFTGILSSFPEGTPGRSPRCRSQHRPERSQGRHRARGRQG